MFKLVRVKKAHFPGFKLAKPIWNDLGKIASASITENIKLGQKTDGSKLGPNARSTQKIKSERGWGNRPLIAKNKSFIRGGKLRSFPWELKKNYIEIKPKGRDWKYGGVAKKRGKGRTKARWVNFRDLVVYVQKKGQKYRGWFGLSKKGEKRIRARLRRFIKKQFKEAAAKR
jgi:hypothetical protein